MYNLATQIATLPLGILALATLVTTEDRLTMHLRPGNFGEFLHMPNGKYYFYRGETTPLDYREQQSGRHYRLNCRLPAWPERRLSGRPANEFEIAFGSRSSQHERFCNRSLLL